MLRVVQYNIHRFLHPSNSKKSTLNDIVSSLKLLSPDVLALNEMDVTTSPTALNDLSQHLKLPHVEFYGHVRQRYGNAILSKFPLKRVVATQLNGGTSVSFPPGTVKEGELVSANFANASSSFPLKISASGLLVDGMVVGGSIFPFF